MQVHHLLYVFHLGIHRELESAKDAGNHFGAYIIMVMESPSGQIVPSFALRFANVVEECCPSQPEVVTLSGHVVKYFECVVEVVLVLPSVAHFHDVEGRQLRKNDLQKSTAVQVDKTFAWCASGHNLVELVSYSLTADDFNPVGISLQCRKGFVVDEEVELCGKPDAAHHAQGVVGEGDIGVEGSADDAVFHVGKSIEGVDKFTIAVFVEAHGQCVDGEITTVLVVLQAAVFHGRLA